MIAFRRIVGALLLLATLGLPAIAHAAGTINVATAGTYNPWGTWKNFSFAPQTGTVETIFTVSGCKSCSGYLGFSNDAVTDYNFAASVVIKNGYVFASGSGPKVAFVSGATYTFRLVMNTSSKTYDAFVKIGSAAEQSLGAGIKFGTSVTNLSDFGFIMWGGFTLSSVSSSATASESGSGSSSGSGTGAGLGSGAVINIPTAGTYNPWGTWKNFSFAPQTGSVQTTFTLSGCENCAGYLGFSNDAITNYNFAASVVIEKGSVYARDSGPFVAFVPGDTYTFRLVMNTSSKTYDAYVKVGSGAEQSLGTGIKFGTTATNLSDFGFIMWGGFALSNVTGSTGTTGTTVPVASFSCTPLSGTFPMSATCTDASSHTPTAWSWTFGDGATSTDKNPSHTYEAAGNYAVTLKASNSAGTDAASRADYIAVAKPGTTGTTVPVASFSCSPLSGSAPMAVTCTDSSSHTPTAWSWTFGDGATSTANNPSHTYEAAGTYTVALTASNSAGMDTASKGDYVTVAKASSGGGGGAGTVAPSPAAPGQTIAVKGNLNAGATASNATVYFWLTPTGKSYIARTSITANFTAGQSSAVQATLTVPATAADGSYTIAAGVYDSAGNNLMWTGDFASLTVAGTSGGGGSGGVNGVCGAANGTTVAMAPTSNLCSTGAASSVYGSGPWSWTCAGADGGATASCSAYSPSSGGGGGGIKFHAGMYIELDPGSGGGGMPGWLSVIASLKGAPGVTGVFLIQPWSAFEGNEGNYSAGFAMVDQLLAAATNANLQLMMGLQGKVFGSYRANAHSYGQLPSYFDTMRDSTGAAPLYLSATSDGTSGMLLITPKNYDPVVTERRIALIQAYGARYDDRANFEMWRDEDETANGLYTDSGQYDGNVTQDIVWAAAARNAFPKTGLSLCTNFMDTPAQFTKLFTEAEPYAIAMGGPDAKPYLAGNPADPAYYYPPTSNIVFNGYMGSEGTVANPKQGTDTDFRNVLPWVSEDQAVAPDETAYTIQDSYDIMMQPGNEAISGSMSPNYYIFSFDATYLTSGTPWTNPQILAFIKSINGAVNSTKPSSY